MHMEVSDSESHKGGQTHAKDDPIHRPTCGLWFMCHLKSGNNGPCAERAACSNSGMSYASDSSSLFLFYFKFYCAICMAISVI